MCQACKCRLLEKCDKLCALYEFLESKGLGEQAVHIMPVALALERACLTEMNNKLTLDFIISRHKHTFDIGGAGVLANCSMGDWYSLGLDFAACFVALAESVQFLLERFLAETDNSAYLSIGDGAVDSARFRISIRRKKSLMNATAATVYPDCGSDIAEPPRIC